MNILYLFFAIILYRTSAGIYKKPALLYLTGIILMGPVNLLVFLLKLHFIIPALTSIVLGIGQLIATYAIIRSPQLLYMLPFKAIKLSVIEKYTGIDIYTYNWDKSLYDIFDPLYTALIESISSFTKETINMGRIKGIELEQGSIQIYASQDDRVYFALLSTKHSHTLTVGMRNFIHQFREMYKDQLKTEIIFQDTFIPTDELIAKCFPYIPHK